MKTDQTAEGSAGLVAPEYERQESEDLQELFKNLSLVNSKNSMTLESQQKVEQIKAEILNAHEQSRKAAEAFNNKMA